MEENPYNATLIKLGELNSGLIIVRVQADESLFSFDAGQYTVLGLQASSARVPMSDPEEGSPSPDRLIRRAYSIASSSVENEYLEFYVSLVRSGALTPRLFALEEGDRLWLGPKAVGQFTLQQVEAEHDLILISTGTGLAPYISMVRTAHRCGEGRKFYVVHGARYSWDLGYRSELQALDHGCGTFSYLPTVTRADETWNGHVGRVQSVLEDGALDSILEGSLDPARQAIFVCGNPSMVEELQGRFEEIGYQVHRKGQPGNLHIERYW